MDVLVGLLFISFLFICCVVSALDKKCLFAVTSTHTDRIIRKLLQKCNAQIQ